MKSGSRPPGMHLIQSMLQENSDRPLLLSVWSEALYPMEMDVMSETLRLSRAGLKLARATRTDLYDGGGTHSAVYSSPASGGGQGVGALHEEVCNDLCTAGWVCTQGSAPTCCDGERVDLAVAPSSNDEAIREVQASTDAWGWAACQSDTIVERIDSPCGGRHKTGMGERACPHRVRLYGHLITTAPPENVMTPSSLISISATSLGPAVRMTRLRPVPPARAGRMLEWTPLSVTPPPILYAPSPQPAP